MSLPLLSESKELPASLKDEKQVRVKLAQSLREEGFDFSVEDTGIRYGDFFNEASISTNRADGRISVTYGISITAKGIAVIVISVLLALLAGIVLALFWYLKYTRLRRSVESAIDSIRLTQKEASRKKR